METVKEYIEKCFQTITTVLFFNIKLRISINKLVDYVCQNVRLRERESRKNICPLWAD